MASSSKKAKYDYEGGDIVDDDSLNFSLQTLDQESDQDFNLSPKYSVKRRRTSFRNVAFDSDSDSSEGQTEDGETPQSPYPKCSVNGLDLGEKGHLVSDFIKCQGEYPALENVNLTGCTLHLQNLVTFMQFLSRCKYLTYLNLSDNPLGEAGHFLTQSIKSWGYKPPLKELLLYNCYIPYRICTELFKSLAVCKDLTHFNLGNNCMDDSGSDLAQSINSWGKYPVLRKIGLHYCSMTVHASGDLTQSLSKCKYLTHIFLSGNKLQDAGHDLAKSIKCWGNYPPLQQLYLYKCSMPLQATKELVQSLSTCQKLTHLDLGGNNLGEAGYDLAQSIKSWGIKSSFQRLYLYDCLMPMDASIELVQSLLRCIHLSHLDLGRNLLSEAGHHLAQVIRAWGDEPLLQDLELFDCSLSVAASLELAQSLATCKHLSKLDLGGNNVGKAGLTLAQSIRSWGQNPPLQELHLYDCLLPLNACSKLVQTLSKCRGLTHLQLGRNSLGEVGHNLAELIRSLGDDSHMQDLILEHCDMPAHASTKLLQELSVCKNLISLDLSGNNIGEAGHPLAQSIKSWGYDPPLQRLYLTRCSMPVGVWNNLFKALTECRRLIEFHAPGYILDGTEYDIPDFLRTLLEKQPKRPMKYKTFGIQQDQFSPQASGPSEVKRKLKSSAQEREPLSMKQDNVEENKIPSLLNLVAEYVDEEDALDSKMKRKELHFEATFTKNEKQYLAARTFGRKVTVKDPMSDLAIQVAKGIKAVVMQSINMDFDLLEKVTSAEECLAAPVVQFHMVEDERTNIEPTESYKYKITIPHYLSKHQMLSWIKVRYGNLNRPHLMTEVQKRNSKSQTFPCYKIHKRHITVYANHFCDVVCTSKEKVCTSKLLAIPFGLMRTLVPDKLTHIKVKTYLCSYLYNNSDLKKKLKAGAAELGLEMLEQLTFPIDYDKFEAEKSEVSVALTVTDPFDWIPTNKNDRTWNGTFNKMLQKSKLQGVFNISNGHLCKSEPFDAANFALKNIEGKTSFCGNIGVTLRTPKIPDQYRDVNLMVPPIPSKVIPAAESRTTTNGQLSEAGDSNLKLTDAKLVKLSNKISKRSDLRTLAVVGLKMERATVDSQFHKNDINDAAYEVLNEWRNSQENETEAYTNICKALKHDDVKLESLIDEVLQ